MTWQDGHAAQLDHLVAEFDRCLVEVENVEAIFAEVDHDDKAANETRAFAALLRSRRIDMAGRARDLRTVPGLSVLPMALTTRNVRR